MYAEFGRTIRATGAVAFIYAVLALAIAGLVQFQLFAAVHNPGDPFSWKASLIARAELLFIFAAIALIASNLIPALILRRFRITSKSAYIASTALSALFASYCFFIIAGTAFNIGAILETTNSATYRVPPFGKTLITTTNLLAAAPKLEPEEWAAFLGGALICGAFGTVCMKALWKRIRNQPGLPRV